MLRELTPTLLCCARQSPDKAEIVLGRMRLLSSSHRFFSKGGSENLIPETVRDSKIYVLEFVMDLMVHIQLAKSRTAGSEMMMDMVERAVS